MKEKKRREIRGGFLQKAVADIKQAVQIGDSLEIRVGYDGEGKQIRRIKALKGRVKEEDFKKDGHLCGTVDRGSKMEGRGK